LVLFWDSGIKNRSISKTAQSIISREQTPRVHHHHSA
jgi:hypothetical protein